MDEPKRLDIDFPDGWGTVDGAEMPETIWAREKDELTAERDKYRDACERLVSYYGDDKHWNYLLPQTFPSHRGYRVFVRDFGDTDGSDFARQVKAELDSKPCAEQIK